MNISYASSQEKEILLIFSKFKYTNTNQNA